MLKREIKKVTEQLCCSSVNGAKEPYGAASNLLNSYS